MSELSNILSHLLKASGNLSGTELARRVDLPSATVNRLITGTVRDPRISTLKAIAKYFNISFDQLLGYSPLPKEFNPAQNRFSYSFQLPIFLMDAVNDMTEQDANSARHRMIWQSGENYSQKDLFAVHIDQANYEPTFLQGSVIIANKALTPKINDYVLVSINNKEATIRKYYAEAGETYLYPLRNELPVINTREEPVKFLGIIIEAQTRFRMLAS